MEVIRVLVHPSGDSDNKQANVLVSVGVYYTVNKNLTAGIYTQMILHI